MDPHFTATGTHAEAVKHIFDTLVWSGDKLQLEPGLAESWSQVEHTVWEFRLRRGVKFHDGSDFTADDVASSIRRMQVSSGPNPTRYFVRRVQEVRIVDPHTVRIVTDGPAPTLPYDFIRLFITSARATAGLTPENSNEAFNSGRAAIGTGPYRFVSWTPREQLVLDRFDGYWGGPQPWQRVVRREIPNDAARVAQLRAGQVDAISRVPASDVSTLQRDPTMRVFVGDTVFVFNIEFDYRERAAQLSAADGSQLSANPLRDLRVRQAISLAIDRAVLAEVAMEGLGKPASQIVTPEIFGASPRLEVPRPNLERARALLREAGYPNGFRMNFHFTNDRLPGDRQVGTAVAQMLSRIGLQVNAVGQPAAVIFPARSRGEFSFVMTGWGTLTGEAHYTLASIGHTNDPTVRYGQFNQMGWTNAELDKLLQDAGAEMNDDRRRALLEQANEVFMREIVRLPLVSISSAWAMRRDRVNMLRQRSDEDTLAMDFVPVR
jgi:peptide/nickel transport system substrate-binding protein